MDVGRVGNASNSLSPIPVYVGVALNIHFYLI